jgi:hypothetical protein
MSHFLGLDSYWKLVKQEEAVKVKQEEAVKVADSQVGGEV